MKLFSNQQVFCKGPLLVNPLGLAAETRVARHREDFFGRVFVAALGPDSLTFGEIDAKICASNANRLSPRRSQMHFNAARLAIDSGYVGELGQVEIGVQLAI